MSISSVQYWHDHTPAYRLPSPEGLRLRLKSQTPLDTVRLLVCWHGEVTELACQAIEAVDGDGFWYEHLLSTQPNSWTMRYAWHILPNQDRWVLSAKGLSRTLPPFRSWFQWLRNYRAPNWLWSSVFYQIFPDRFRNSNPENSVKTGEYLYNNRPVQQYNWNDPIDLAGDVHAHYGGDLGGIEAALPYLQELGVNALWLTPIFDSPSNHRYDTRDYLQVDPHLGGNAAFTRLLGALKQHHFRIVLDGVFNHTGQLHELFIRAQNPQAPERDMYTWRSEEYFPRYAAFFDVPSLPKIDYSSPLAFNYFIDGPYAVIRHWLREGIDGWRLDVAHMMGQYGTELGNLEVHQRIKKAARQENEDAFIVGERFFDAEGCLDGRGEDAVMNYHGFGLPFMEWLSGQTIGGHPSQLDTTELIGHLWDAYHILAPEIALNQFNIIESHDIPRAFYRLQHNRTLMLSALTALVSYPGVPCWYYGSEIGLSQQQAGAMPFCRGTMPWDSTQWDQVLLEHSKRLIQIRKSQLALQAGNFIWLQHTPHAFAFLREYHHADGRCERVAVLISRSTTPQAFQLELPLAVWHDALSDTELGYFSELNLEFSGALILVAEHID